MNIFKRLIRFFINLFKLLWETVKTMKTRRGILALFLSLMIFAGWAYIFIGIGIIFNIPSLVAIGSAVALFWLGPFTPLIPIVILVAFFIQRYLFRDRSNDQALKEAIANFKKEVWRWSSVKDSYARRIKLSRLHSYKTIILKLKEEIMSKIKINYYCTCCGPCSLSN